jgi:hypothetical protein
MRFELPLRQKIDAGSTLIPREEILPTGADCHAAIDQ